MLRGRAFRARELELIRRAEDFRRPGELPIFFGERVALNSGGPQGLVVDILPETKIVVAWAIAGNNIIERTLPAACVHRT
jgi:hypothetical protein